MKFFGTYWFDRSLLALLIATTAWLSLTLARGPGELSAIWVGNGILTVENEAQIAQPPAVNFGTQPSSQPQQNPQPAPAQ